MSDKDKNELSVKTLDESEYLSIPILSDEQPPNDVFSTAVESRSGRIQFVNKDAEPNSEFYVYHYFSEFIKDAQFGQRKYNVTIIGNTSNSYGPFRVSDYLTPDEWIGTIVTGQGGGYTITIEATSDSKFFPILSASELFQILKVPSLPTHPDDGMDA